LFAGFGNFDYSILDFADEAIKASGKLGNFVIAINW
jgi:hypothetical protein